ncbi:MAG: SpoIIE family protein phosphatase [Solobacterium sp.]|nr:SpoIIE family protein phosphatase [Solobacterium sp.]
MQLYLSLLAAGIMPVAASALLSRLFRQEKMKAVSDMKKQILCGLVFGVIAIAATEFGVPFNGTVINVRDAAPLCAGLLFGGPAGIIAGTVGAAERWFAVYWGVGEFTRTACTISTFLAGLIAAALRKYMFDEKAPALQHCILIGVVVEVIHMLMIFLMGIAYVKFSFRYVRVCSMPMILVNTIALTAAAYAAGRAGGDDRSASKDRIPTISDIFQVRLITIILLAFLSTSLFTYIMQNQIASENTSQLFQQNLNDVRELVSNQYRDHLLHINRGVAAEITENGFGDIRQIKRENRLSEIDVIGKDGTILASTDPSLTGKEISNAVPFSDYYLELLESGEYFEQEVERNTENNSSDEIYKSTILKAGDGMVCVSVSREQYQETADAFIREIIAQRQIGEDGGIIYYNNEYAVIDSTWGLLYDVKTEKRMPVEIDIAGHNEYSVYTCRIGEKEYYCMHVREGSNYLVSVCSVDEADFSKSLSIYLNFYLLTITFATLFVIVYLTIKYLIVGNIQKVNSSLSQITDGDLDTVVDVRSSREFIDLSDDINSTVDTLKRYIAEANARIDTELKYAKDIQSSALPSVFPDREEIDLYALMNPAREVGGDFYDFYFLEGNRLVFLVADVSGKGIPASLFMMRAKTILKTYAENRIGIADIFTNVNYQLCEGNDASMFVTAWMGILDLETGILKFANAGHNRPLVRRGSGEYEFLKEKPGFVLAGMEGMSYKEQTLTLEPGDEIFLYTDGVVEATNAQQELYGDDRLRTCLNRHAGESAKKLCESVRKDVDEFYDGAPLFDDITELSMKFRKYASG